MLLYNSNDFHFSRLKVIFFILCNKHQQITEKCHEVGIQFFASWLLCGWSYVGIILSQSCFASPLINLFLFVKILLSNVSYLIFIISISLRIIFPPNCLSCQPCPSFLEPSSTILMDPLYMLLHAPVPKLFLGGANLTSPNLLTTMQAKSNSVIT